MLSFRPVHAECPLEQAARRWPHRTAICTGTSQITFQQWNQRCWEIARSLSVSEWQPGDRIGLVARTGESFLIHFFGCLRAGMVVVLISPRWPVSLIEFAERETRWNALWSDPETIPHAIRLPTEMPSDLTPKLATVIFTSGSTGRPKALAHTLEAHLASAQGANENLPLDAKSVWLLSLSPAHVGGLGIIFRCLVAGATIHVPLADSPLEQSLQVARPSHLSLVPTQLKRLIDRNWKPWSELRGLLVGGAPIPRGLIEQAIADNWPMVTTYGLSEMASQVTASFPSAELGELLTAGRLLPGRELKLAANGEILVRGNSLFAGWIQQGQLVPGTDAAGWYHTGDLGSLDASGRLQVLGRLDNQFISGGENIHPESIEQTLNDFPSVVQAMVVPVEHPEYGQRPVAFVEATVWQPEAWQLHLASTWPRFMLPDRYFAMPEGMGDKPSRSRLKELAKRLLV